MGILSSLLNKLTGGQLDQVKKTLEENLQKAGFKPETASTVANAATAPVQKQQPAYAQAPVVHRSEAEWIAFFREIIQAEYPTLGIRENVPVTDVAGYANDTFKLYSTRPYQAYKAEWGQPYTFALYDGAVLKGVVMLGSGHSHDTNVKFLIARKYAQKAGAPYINFYTQMPNQRGYVIFRLKRFLHA